MDDVAGFVTSIIARNLPTQTVPPLLVQRSVEEKDSDFFDLLQQIKPVTESGLCQILTLELVSQCSAAIATGDADQFPFDFAHKFYEDYMTSDVVIIRMKRRKEGQTFGCAPARSSVINWLHDQQQLQLAAVAAKDQTADSKEVDVFHSELNNVQMEFMRHCRKLCEKLTEFISGSLFWKGVAYFKVGEHWCQMMEAFLLSADKQYIECMRSCAVVEASNEAFVDLPWSAASVVLAQTAWQRDMKEHRYNLLYLGRRVPTTAAVGTATHFLYGDESYLRLRENRSDLELWDFLKITPTRTYAVQVKIGFANSLRVACAQIRNAAQLLYAHDVQETADKWLSRALEKNQAMQTQRAGSITSRRSNTIGTIMISGSLSSTHHVLPLFWPFRKQTIP